MIFLLFDIQVVPLKMCWKVWIKASRWHPSKTILPVLFHSDLCGHWRDMFSCRQMSSGLAFTKANTHVQVLMEGYHITFMFCYQYISSFQLLNCVQLFATPWTTANQASMSITNSWSLLKCMSIESMMPSNHLILCHSLLLPRSVFPSIRVFSNESALHIKWPKYWNFSFSVSPSNEHSGLISFMMDWLDLPAVQGTLKSLLQHHSSKASILWHSAFFIVQLSHPYMTAEKTIALTRWTFVGKVMSLFLNVLLGWS